MYGDDIKDVEWFNIAAMGLDRSLLQNTGKNTWIEQAEYIKENVTDEAIQKAFANLPEETTGEATQELIKNVQGEEIIWLISQIDITKNLRISRL